MTDNTVYVQKTVLEHHHEAAERPQKMSDALKARIAQMTAQGVKPKRIHVLFTQEGIDPLPTLEQIQGYVKRLRIPATTAFTDHQLREYCEANSAEPDDPNKYFVLAYDVPSSDTFFVVWTTKRLLERQLSSTQLQADATSSTNWHNFPLLVLGHSDFDHRFHPTLLAIGKSENTYVYDAIFRSLREREYHPTEVLGDGTPAITAAVKANFPLAKREMCSVHVMRRADVHLLKIPAHLRNCMHHEIEMLQFARTDVQFERVAKMLLEVWADEEDPAVQAFAEYFRDTWVDSDLRNWHEGTTEACVNNNGLESVNKRIKEDFLMREMHAFEHFLSDVAKILSYWSIHLKDKPQLPTIPLIQMKKAVELMEDCKEQPDGSPAKRLYLRVVNSSKYVFAASDSGISSLNELYDAYRKFFVDGPSTWDEYAESRFRVHLVEPAARHFGQFYECSCPVGAKKAVCKHATMVMCSLEKMFAYSPEAVAEPMKDNRRAKKKKSQSGRPPLAPRQNRFAAAD